MKTKFIEFVDDTIKGSAVKQLNEEIERSFDKLIDTKYQVVRYEGVNRDRTYILSEWEIRTN